MRRNYYIVNVEESMSLYHDRTVHQACAKIAKGYFKGENVLTGYD